MRRCKGAKGLKAALRLAWESDLDLLEVEPGAELDDSWRVVDLRDTSEVIAVDIQSCGVIGVTVG